MHFFQSWLARYARGSVLVERAVMAMEVQELADCNILVSEDCAMMKKHEINETLEKRP